jgi:hypothetical protein
MRIINGDGNKTPGISSFQVWQQKDAGYKNGQNARNGTRQAQE